MWRDTNSLSELEFLAETCLIEIIPNFKKDELRLICGTYGPFKPSKPVQVPLWLALQLKKNKKCQLIPPTWMEINFLTQKIEIEKANEILQELPYYFFEICQMLFHNADDDIDQLKEIKLIIEDLKAIRFAKINKNLDMASPDGLSLCLNNICARELEQIRPFVSEVYSYKLEMLNCNISNREDRFENMNPNNFQFN